MKEQQKKLYNRLQKYACNRLQKYAIVCKKTYKNNGSIAYYFRPQLEKALKAEGMTLGRIIKAPMEGLIEYHK